VLIVARIAYLASDVIISVQPAQGQDSEYSSHLKRYAVRRDQGLVSKSEGAIPEVRFQLPEYSYNLELLN
jgi:sulfite reductase (NADPH) hemoprotein beta-component